jgi:hypothetical protein
LSIARVQAFGSGATTGASTTIAATAGSSVTAGNGLIVITGNNAASPTVSGVSDTHNTYTQFSGVGISNANLGFDIWYCKNVGTGGTLTVTVTWTVSGGGLLTVIEVSGQDTVTFKDVQKSATATSTALSSGAASSTAQANEFLVGVGFQVSAGTGAFSSPTFSTALVSVNTETAADNTTTADKGLLTVYDGILASTAAETFSVTSSGSHPYACAVAAFLPAATGGTITPVNYVQNRVPLIRASVF